MSFRINTNITAMNAYKNSLSNDSALSASLGKLSSGLQIQSAADDASGMTIADSLRAQASALGQAIKNANDAAGIVETADNAMNEQISILNTIKTKATQSAQDGQSKESRAALQRDISRLLEQLDNIANQTSFNGQTLLNGNYSNRNFQIGAYSNETVQVSIGATNSNKIGHTRFETSANVAHGFTALGTALGSLTLQLQGIDGYPAGYTFEAITGKEFTTEGFKILAERINLAKDETGVKANVNNSLTFNNAIKEGTINGLMINGASIGTLALQNGDRDEVLVNAINAIKEQTGVIATKDNGKLKLTSLDGRAITIHVTTSTAADIQSVLGVNSAMADAMIASAHSVTGVAKQSTGGFTNVGRITLIRQDSRDIDVRFVTGASTFGALAGINVEMTALGAISAGSIIKAMGANSYANLTSTLGLTNGGVSQKTVSLADLNTGVMEIDYAEALGYFSAGSERAKQLSGVTTYAGAQAMIDIAEAAQRLLDTIRSDLGSAENQLKVTISNITTTQVNVTAAESQIRDVDFASEASNFNKFNILAQSGSYAMSQANTVQQNVLRLLQ
jgi:flagellin